MMAIGSAAFHVPVVWVYWRAGMPLLTVLWVLMALMWSYEYWADDSVWSDRMLGPGLNSTKVMMTLYYICHVCWDVVWAWSLV